MLRKILIALLVLLVAGGLLVAWLLRGETADYTVAETSGRRPVIDEPNAQTIPTIALAEPVGWKAGEAPVAAQGLAVSAFASGLDHPRAITVLPNGDVLVAETNSPPRDAKGIEGMVMKWLMKRVGAGGESPNRIQLLRDGDGDGRAEQKFLLREGLASPFGMVLRGEGEDSRLIVANHDAVLSFPYKLGDTQLTGTPEKLMDLPPGGNHWVRNLLLSPDQSKLYVTVGSASNIAEGGIEKEKGRAGIWEYDFAKGSAREFAGGLRNPNGMDFNPATGELWTVVNERDMLGSDLVPDYLTNVPFGAQYGWPWAYWKNRLDERVKAPMPQYLLEYTRKPEYALGAHTAPLGLAFARGGHRMGEGFASGAFIARHGSWNRKPASGYDVVFVGFDERGNVLDAKPVPVLTGFLTRDGKNSRGRPTWLAFANDGALLVSDDTGGVIWRVIAPQAEPAPAIQPMKTAAVPKRPELRETVARPNEKSTLVQPR